MKKNKRDVFQFFHENRNSIPIFSKHLNPLSEFFFHVTMKIHSYSSNENLKKSSWTLHNVFTANQLSVSCLPLDEGPTGPTAGFCFPGGRFLRWKSDTDEKSSNW